MGRYSTVPPDTIIIKNKKKNLKSKSYEVWGI